MNLHDVETPAPARREGTLTETYERLLREMRDMPVQPLARRQEEWRQYYYGDFGAPTTEATLYYERDPLSGRPRQTWVNRGGGEDRRAMDILHNIQSTVYRLRGNGFRDQDFANLAFTLYPAEYQVLTRFLAQEQYRGDGTFRFQGGRLSVMGMAVVVV